MIDGRKSVEVQSINQLEKESTTTGPNWVKDIVEEAFKAPTFEDIFFTRSQIFQAIEEMFTINGQQDSTRVESIYAQLANKQDDGSAQIPFIRNLLILKAKQLIFANPVNRKGGSNIMKTIDAKAKQ